MTTVPTSEEAPEADLPPSPAEQTAAVAPPMWRRAPGWAFTGLTAVGAFLLVWSASYPTGSAPLFLLGFAWLVPCALVWTVRLITYLVGLRNEHRSGPFWPFLVAPVGAVATLALCSSTLPLDVRWAVSRSAFDTEADQLQAESERRGVGEDHLLIEDEQIGLYAVSSAWVDEHGNAFFVVNGSGFIDGGGFARFPGDVPTPSGDDDYEHLQGDWYVWFDAF